MYKYITKYRTAILKRKHRMLLKNIGGTDTHLFTKYIRHNLSKNRIVFNIFGSSYYKYCPCCRNSHNNLFNPLRFHYSVLKINYNPTHNNSVNCNRGYRFGKLIKTYIRDIYQNQKPPLIDLIQSNLQAVKSILYQNDNCHAHNVTFSHILQKYPNLIRYMDNSNYILNDELLNSISYRNIYSGDILNTK